MIQHITITANISGASHQISFGLTNIRRVFFYQVHICVMVFERSI